MKNLAVELEVIVLGREIFTDLWRLFGFKAVICEDPNNVYAIWKELISENVAAIIVEDDWFSEMPLRLRLLAERSVTPAWVQFPTLSLEGENIVAK